jgi:general secretion pathway protein G
VPSPDHHNPPRKITACNEPGPKSLEVLVTGEQYVPSMGVDDVLKLLRKIPRDPFTNSTEWGIRCYSQKPDDYSGCSNGVVWDVFTKSNAIALNGTKVKEW